MRKKLGIIFSIVFIGLLSGCANSEVGEDVLNKKGIILEDSLSGEKVLSDNGLSAKEIVLEEVQNEIIRFHVLANSDTEEDQALKIKVRDRVIEKMYDKLKNIENIDEARDIMIASIDEVNKIAEEVINENGYNYSVRSELSRENFPDKMYGETLYPQGNYEAFRILIGEAEGQNWWCVLFPPLCFVDETKQAVKSNDDKEGLEVVDDSREVKKENNINENRDTVKPKEKVKFKFKLLEFFRGN